MNIYKKDKIWELILEELSHQIDNNIYLKNFINCKIDFNEKKGLTIYGSKINIALLKNDFYSQLSAAAEKVLNTKTKIDFVIIKPIDHHGEISPELLTKQEELGIASFDLEEVNKPEIVFDQMLEKDFYQYDNFIIHEGNKFAVEIGRGFIDNLSNKLIKICFFYGGIGVGKTHFAFSLINYAKKIFKNSKKILYFDSFKLTLEYNNLLKNKDFDFQTFIDKYSKCDLLIIDDLQKFQELIKVNTILFNLIEYMSKNDKKIIFFSSERVQDLVGFDEALRSRILSGRQCEIKKPNPDAIKILIKSYIDKVAPNLKITDGAINYLAFLLGKDIRVVFGHLSTLLFYLVTGKQLIMVDSKTVETVIEQTGIIGTIPKNGIDNEYNYIQRICEKLNVNLEEILSPSRKQDIVNNRNIIAYILKTEMKYSLAKIGKILQRDHSTIRNSLNQIKLEFKNNKHFKDYIKSITPSINSTDN
ncbi:Chromosomal replication initiator protein DnaA [[Mycoplasma] cavipharyngis]|uniref:DnaA ATPase domain-containing protein n=1 Tax=[Mycoplasma] cavipharyngis TaxID=92757 RepID=UPI0037041B12